MAPAGLGISRRPAFFEGRAGEGLDVGPVDGERTRRVFVLGTDRRLDEIVDEALEEFIGLAVPILLGHGAGEEAERPLHLAVAQKMRTALPLDHDAESSPVVFAQGEQRVMHAAQMGRSPVREGEEDADKHGAHAELARLARRAGGGPRGAGPRPRRRRSPRGAPARPRSRVHAEERHHGGLVTGIETGHHVAQTLGAHHTGGGHEGGQPDVRSATRQPGRAQPGQGEPGQVGPSGERGA